ncbi:MAG: YceI family protein [Flavipsychrobacter sp.]|nr:YceI family protein [Flavipsychrobacter sp.]
MKNTLIAFLILLLCPTASFAQKYLTRTGKIYFNATTKSSPEKIEGVNNEVASILDIKTGDVIFQVPVKSFKFERELMQEHFNENYMESDKFPKAEFRGAIKNIGEINVTKDGTYDVKVAGKLTIHGVTNEVTVPGTIAVNGKTVKLKAKFAVILLDYKVKVPNLVADKVTKEAIITIESDLAQK